VQPPQERTPHASSAPSGPQDDIALGLPRLYALRAAFLVMGGGLAAVQWPTVGDLPEQPLFEGVARSMFVALSVLGLLGVRHPVRLLPVLVFEVLWKAVWLAAVAVPTWRSHSMDAATRATLIEVLPIVVVAAVVPWRYVVGRYLVDPGDRWRRTAPDDVAAPEVRGAPTRRTRSLP
jgi:hypothetical protein